MLTNDVRKGVVEKTIAKLRTQVAAARGVDPEDVDMSNVEAFYILDGAYIDGALKAAEAQYGSMDAYIREGLGMSEAELSTLRSTLLE